MSAYVSTCRHISAHAGIYTGGDTCHYPSKVQMTGIRGAESDVRYWHMPARVSILAHVSTCRHVSRSWHITAHTRMSVHEQASKIRSKSLVSDLPSVMLYMLAHVSTCRYMSACFQALTHASTSKDVRIWIRSRWWSHSYWECRHMSVCLQKSTHADMGQLLYADILTVTFFPHLG